MNIINNSNNYIHKKSFFDEEKDVNTQTNLINNQQASYLSSSNNSFSFLGREQKDDSANMEVVEFGLIKEEDNIFSSVPGEYFNSEYSDKQKTWVASFLWKFKKRFIQRINNKTSEEKYPKISVIDEEDGSINLSIISKKYRLFLSFEREKEKSYYGYLILESEASMKTETDLLSPENEDGVIDSFIDIIMGK